MLICNVVSAHRGKTTADLAHFLAPIEAFAKTDNSPSEADFDLLSDLFFKALSLHTKKKHCPITLVASYLFYGLQFNKDIRLSALRHTKQFKLDHKDIAEDFTVERSKTPFSAKEGQGRFKFPLHLLLRTQYSNDGVIAIRPTDNVSNSLLDEIFCEVPRSAIYASKAEKDAYRAGFKLNVTKSLFKFILHFEGTTEKRQSLFDSLTQSELEYIEAHIDVKFIAGGEAKDLLISNDMLPYVIKPMCLRDNLAVIHKNLHYFIKALNQKIKRTYTNPLGAYENCFYNRTAGTHIVDVERLMDTISGTPLADLLEALTLEPEHLNDITIGHHIDVLGALKDASLLDIIESSPLTLKPLFLEQLSS